MTDIEMKNCTGRKLVEKDDCKKAASVGECRNRMYKENDIYYPCRVHSGIFKKSSCDYKTRRSRGSKQIKCNPDTVSDAIKHTRSNLTSATDRLGRAASREVARAARQVAKAKSQATLKDIPVGPSEDAKDPDPFSIMRIKTARMDALNKSAEEEYDIMEKNLKLENILKTALENRKQQIKKYEDEIIKINNMPLEPSRKHRIIEKNKAMLDILNKDKTSKTAILKTLTQKSSSSTVSSGGKKKTKRNKRNKKTKRNKKYKKRTRKY